MAGDPKECREHAKRCLELAEPYSNLWQKRSSKISHRLGCGPATDLDRVQALLKPGRRPSSPKNWLEGIREPREAAP